MLEKSIPLEDHPDPSFPRAELGDVSATQVDPARGGIFQPADQPQKSGLAGAGGADQGRELVGRDLEVEARGADERLAAGAQRVVALVELLDADADAVFGDDDPASGSGSGS